MQTWPDFFPIWDFAYSGENSPAVIRSSLPGHVEQRKISNKVKKTISVSLILEGVELPMFEYFVRDLCNEGTDKFYGKYKDGNGMVTGVMRLIGGAYDVKNITPSIQRVSCTVEVF